MRLAVPFQRDKTVLTGDITGVREVNIAADPEIAPVRKVSGGEIGDVRTGWFRLANGTKAFLALQGTRALYLETTLGFPVMVGAREFADFEAAFRDHVYGLYESGAE